MTIIKPLLAALCCSAIWTLSASLMAPQGGGPEKTVKAFFTAMQKGDFEKAKKYGDDNADQILDLMKAMMSNMPKQSKKVTIKNVTCDVDGDSAICNGCCGQDGEPLRDVKVEKINGQWLVVMKKEDMNKEEPPFGDDDDLDGED